MCCLSSGQKADTKPYIRTQKCWQHRKPELEIHSFSAVKVASFPQPARNAQGIRKRLARKGEAGILKPVTSTPYNKGFAHGTSPTALI